MTALRHRLIDDLRLRNYSPRTIEAYVAGVARFAKHFGRSPDRLGPEEVRTFQLHLLERKVSWSQFNQTVCALRFFYAVTLGHSAPLPHIPYGKIPRTLPDVLSPQEVLQLLQAAPSFPHHVIFSTMYGTGMRVSEAVHLRAGNIDSQRMMIRIPRRLFWR